MLWRTTMRLPTFRSKPMRTRSRLFPGWGIPEFAMTATLMLIAGVAHAGPFFFSTGTVNNFMATASRPDAAGKFEIEAADDFVLRSEEHTSELQSLRHLVCRLLLEKKKTQHRTLTIMYQIAIN